jgi:hypothetical protein
MAPNTVLSSTALAVHWTFFNARKSEYGIQGYDVLKAHFDTDTTIIAGIRPACKHLSSNLQNIIAEWKMPLCLAKDDW